MKKLGIILLGLTLSMGTFAQEVKEKKPQKSSEEIAKKKTDQLTKNLELTPDQSKKIEATMLEDLKSGKAMREKHRAMKDKMRAEIKAHKTSSSNNVRNQLTEDQKVKYDTMLAERKEKRESEKGKKHEGKGKHPKK